ncbi:hypothetical protein ACQKQA_25005, partial [Pseudomonas sp. NPDC089530]
MFNRSKRSSVYRTTSLATLMLGSLTLPAQAVEINSSNASYYDSISALHQEVDRTFTLRPSGFSVDDLQKLQAGLKDHTSELEKLKKIVDSQDRLIEELKRNTGNSSSSNASDMSNLRKTTSEQASQLAKLEKQLEEFKRNSGSSASSNTNEVSNLKRVTSDQASELDKLGKQIEELKRGSSSSSSSSSSELSSLKST